MMPDSATSKQVSMQRISMKFSLLHLFYRAFNQLTYEYSWFSFNFTAFIPSTSKRCPQKPVKTKKILLGKIDKTLSADAYDLWGSCISSNSDLCVKRQEIFPSEHKKLQGLRSSFPIRLWNIPQWLPSLSMVERKSLFKFPDLRTSPIKLLID